MAVVLIIANIGTNINMTCAWTWLSLREWFSWYNKYDKDKQGMFGDGDCDQCWAKLHSFYQLFLFFFLNNYQHKILWRYNYHISF